MALYFGRKPSLYITTSVYLFLGGLFGFILARVPSPIEYIQRPLGISLFLVTILTFIILIWREFKSQITGAAVFSFVMLMILLGITFFIYRVF